MQVDLSPSLEHRLIEVARQRAVPATTIVEEVLTRFLQAIPDDPATWVKLTQQRLPAIWPAEDFSDWKPPRGT